MSMMPYPRNPIERRKADVRRYSRNAAISVGVGAVSTIVGGIVLGSNLLLVLGIILIVVGGGGNALKVRKIVNHRDES